MDDAKTHPMRIAVFGATGYVGREICMALTHRGAQVLRHSAPRLPKVGLSEVSTLIEDWDLRRLVNDCRELDAVINAAGIADAGAANEADLTAANGALPGLLGRLAADAGIARYVHVSSAAVQGAIRELDDSAAEDGFSPYSASKSIGEATARAFGPVETVVYRPPGVHDESRQVTRSLARFARSRLSSVVAPGTQGSPQALLKNVGDAVAALALHPTAPPGVVSHPSEGLTVRSLLCALGGREPVIIPRTIGVHALAIAKMASTILPFLCANVRRLEVLWFGQEQKVSWLTGAGWSPIQGQDSWKVLGNNLRPNNLLLRHEVD